MAYNLKGKSIQQLKLSTDGSESSVKVIIAKQSDVNSRFICPILTDSRGVIDCSELSVQLNVTTPNGTKLTSYGEVIEKKAYVKINREMLSELGKLSCDITYTGYDNGVPFVLTSETFYILVRESNYNIDAEVGEDITTLSEWVRGQIGDMSSQVVVLTGQVENLSSRVDGLEIAMPAGLESTESGMLRLVDANGNPIGESIPISAAIDGFVTEIDEEGDTVLYLAYGGEPVGEGIKINTVGGGGGGSGDTGAIIKITNRMPSRTWTVTGSTLNSSAVYNISYSWESLDKESSEATGYGNAAWYVNNSRVALQTNLEQGDQSFNIKPFLRSGTENTVKLTMEDSLGNKKSFVWYITVSSMSVSWNLEDIKVCGSTTLTVLLTPSGVGTKTMHLAVDGNEIYTQETTVSGRTFNTVVPSQSHGVHTLTAWITATIDGESVSSDVLKSKCIWVKNSTPIVAVLETEATIMQAIGASFSYYVYDPQAENANVTLSVNGSIVNTLTVGRTTQLWEYKANHVTEEGTPDILTITCGSASASIQVVVEPLDIDVKEVTGAILEVNPSGHSNGEANKEQFGYKDASGVNHPFVFSDGFDWVNGGFQNDDEGVTAFVIKKGSYIEFDRSLFNDNAKNDGKEIKIIFKSTNVRNYDAEILNCLSEADGIGIKLQAQQATLACSTNTLISHYCEDKKIELDINIDSFVQGETNLAMVWLSGVPSRTFEYSNDTSWQQSTQKVVRIGSDDADVWIYKIKMYGRALSRPEIVDNYIADCSNGEEMYARFNRNNIYATDGTSIDINKLAENNQDLRIIHISADRMTTSKSDKVYCTVQHIIRGKDETHNFTATNVTMKAQGTSSLAYGAAALNLDLDFSSATSWANEAGDEMNEYAMTQNSIPVDYFNIKLNVASSENANNVCLADDYNTYQPYITESRKNNPKVRDTVEGHPCVVFFTNTTGQTIQVSSHVVAAGETILYGCGDMNNSKKNIEVFGHYNENYPDQCCIEILNNNSAQCLFQSDDLTDELFDGDGNFEPRFPDGELTDAMKTAFQSMLTWVVSTNPEAATGEALAEPVTYGGVEYTTDSADCRKAKFKAELEQYFAVDSLLYHYLFTERHCMIDNRAKNTFISYEWDVAKGKYLWNFNKDYDNDTGEGNDNSGGLTFTYGIEDTDTVEGRKAFNASTSVLWCNLRDMFATELANMFVDRESAGAWNAKRILKKFNDYQKARPEALVAEDMYAKYIAPGTAVVGGEGTTRYYTILLGTKEDQRMQFETYQEKYMASKYVGNLATNSRIEFRPQTGKATGGIVSSGCMTIKPYSDMYIVVKYGNAKTIKLRAKKNTEYNIDPGALDISDLETYLYLSENITELTGLAGLYTRLAEIASADKLQKFELGSGNTGYINDCLESITLSNNGLLEYVDLRGVKGTTNFGSTLDLTNLVTLKEFYAANSGITGVTFANGASVENITLPAIRSLTARNLTELVEFQAMYNNLAYLWVENTPIIDTYAAVSAAENLQRGRITNVSWPNASIDVLVRLASLRGIDALGREIDEFVLTGTAHVVDLSQDELDLINEKFPNLALTYDSIVEKHTITFVDESGNVCYVLEVKDGNAPINPANEPDFITPTKANTVEHKYVFANTWTPRIVVAHEDATYTAVFQELPQDYSVRFDDTLSETSLSYEKHYGETCSHIYNWESVFTGDYANYHFMYWTDNYGNVYETNDVILNETNCFLDANNNPIGIILTPHFEDASPKKPAMVRSTLEEYTIQEIKWLSNAIEGQYDGTDVVKKEQLVDGTYSIELTDGKIFYLALGDTKDITLTDGTVMTMLLSGFMLDKKADGTSVGISFTTKDLYKTKTNQHYSALHSLCNYKVNGEQIAENQKVHSFTCVNPAGTGGDFNVELDILGDTRFASISVLNSAGHTTTYYFNGTVGTDDDANTYLTLGTTSAEMAAPGASFTWQNITFDATNASIPANSNSQYAITRTGEFLLLYGGAKITIPVSEGDVMTITAYESWNIGGYNYSKYRTYLNETMWELIPAYIRELIVGVNKGSTIGGKSSIIETFNEKIWALSISEVNGSSAAPYNIEGVKYPVYTDNASRIKKYSNGTGSAGTWWLRSPHAGSYGNFWGVHAGGSCSYYGARDSDAVAFGFCL